MDQYLMHYELSHKNENLFHLTKIKQYFKELIMYINHDCLKHPDLINHSEFIDDAQTAFN
jgi:hypothetical protein